MHVRVTQVEWYSGVKPSGEEVQVMRPGSSVPTGVGSAARCLFLSLEVVAASKDYFIQRRFTAEGYMYAQRSLAASLVAFCLGAFELAASLVAFLCGCF